MSFDSYADKSNEQQVRSSGEVVRLNLIVPQALRKEWKSIALVSDKTLPSFIIGAVQHQVNRVKEVEISTK